MFQDLVLVVGKRFFFFLFSWDVGWLIGFLVDVDVLQR